MSGTNPYESPRASPADGLAPPGPSTPLGQIVHVWERLRLVHLAWLSLVSLAVFAAVGLDALPLGEFRFWATLVVGFVGANICFTAGHLAEVVVVLIGAPRLVQVAVRQMIFVLGSFFASLLTVFWIVGIAVQRL